MDHLSVWAHETSFMPLPTSASAAREFVGGHLLEHGLKPMVDDIRAVVSELATNAVVHAGTPYSVSLARDGSSVTLSVQDGARSLPTLLRGSILETGGKGLLIVGLLSTAWGVTSAPGGTKDVWATFAVDGGADG